MVWPLGTLFPSSSTPLTPLAYAVYILGAPQVSGIAGVAPSEATSVRLATLPAGIHCSRVSDTEETQSAVLDC